MQKLILPINRAKLTASWKTDSYRARFGFNHYGVDMVSAAGSRLVYAQGRGTVLLAGRDSVLGNTVVVRYEDVYNPNTGAGQDMIARMYHFDSLFCKKGQVLTKDSRLGYYGSTGQYAAGAHLHLELDTDLGYPFYTPTLSGVSTFFKGSRLGATDKTMVNPISWTHCKISAPDYQSYTTARDGYIRGEDWKMAKV